MTGGCDLKATSAYPATFGAYFGALFKDWMAMNPAPAEVLQGVRDLWCHTIRLVSDVCRITALHLV